MVETAGLIIVPALIAGLLIGIYEAITLMKDVRAPQGKFGHATHALVLAVIFTFASFNVDFVLSLVPALQNIALLGNAIVVRIIIGLILAIKVHAVSRATKSTAGVSGLAETWTHTFIIGILVALVPYLWPLIAPALPVWLQ